jgi:hypothetical protein
MDQLFGFYHEIKATLTTHLQDEKQAIELARQVLPVAATNTLHIQVSDDALEQLLAGLLSDTVPGIQRAAQSLLAEVKNVKPTFFHDQTIFEQNKTAVTYAATRQQKLTTLIKEYIPEQYADPTSPVRLAEVWPRNEFDLVPEMVYGLSNLPLQNLKQQTVDWPYTKKVNIFEAYLGERTSHNQRPGNALQKVHYTWDLITPYDTFHSLQAAGRTKGSEWQELTPRYGYDVPKAIDDAGLTDQFETCFDLSLRLHSLLQGAGYIAEAQYATLHGHQLRWKLHHNGCELFAMLEQSVPQTATWLQAAMREKVGETHSLISEALLTPPTQD